MMVCFRKEQKSCWKRKKSPFATSFGTLRMPKGLKRSVAKRMIRKSTYQRKPRNVQPILTDAPIIPELSIETQAKIDAITEQMPEISAEQIVQMVPEITQEVIQNIQEEQVQAAVDPTVEPPVSVPEAIQEVVAEIQQEQVKKISKFKNKAMKSLKGKKYTRMTQEQRLARLMQDNTPSESAVLDAMATLDPTQTTFGI